MGKVLLTVFLLAGCVPGEAPPPAPAPVPPTWTTFRASGPFTIRVAPDLVKDARMFGIDSQADLLRSPTIEMGFDYGQWSCGLSSGSSGEQHAISSGVIDGREVTFDRYRTAQAEPDRGDERLAANFPDKTATNRLPQCLTVYAACTTAAACDEAKAMIETIDFDPPG